MKYMVGGKYNVYDKNTAKATPKLRPPYQVTELLFFANENVQNKWWQEAVILGLIQKSPGGNIFLANINEGS